MTCSANGPPDQSTGVYIYYFDDGALYREKAYIQEVLNGSRWEYLTFNVSTSTRLSVKSALERFPGADLLGPNTGISAAMTDEATS